MLICGRGPTEPFSKYWSATSFLHLAEEPDCRRIYPPRCDAPQCGMSRWIIVVATPCSRKDSPSFPLIDLALCVSALATQRKGDRAPRIAIARFPPKPMSQWLVLVRTRDACSRSLLPLDHDVQPGTGGNIRDSTLSRENAQVPGNVARGLKSRGLCRSRESPDGLAATALGRWSPKDG